MWSWASSGPRTPGSPRTPDHDGINGVGILRLASAPPPSEKSCLHPWRISCELKFISGIVFGIDEVVGQTGITFVVLKRGVGAAPDPRILDRSGGVSVVRNNRNTPRDAKARRAIVFSRPHAFWLKSEYKHEFRETCHSVTFIVLVNSHQR